MTPDGVMWIEDPAVPEPEPPPRIWSALVVGILALPVSWVTGGVVLGVVALAFYGPSLMQSPDWLTEFTQTRFGLLVVILPGQLVFLAASVGAAAFSSETFRQRLALERGCLPLWTWAVFVLATPVVGIASSLLLSQLVDEPSEQLRLMSEMMRAHAQGGFVVVLLLLVGVLPGFVEELLFRGYMQSRLLRRWPPVVAIAASTLVFAAAHMDPLHVVGVLPLGIWLGLVAWRADSVWPAMLCHGINNAIAVAGTVLNEPDVIDVTFDPTTIVSLAIGGPAMLLSLVIFASGIERSRR
jgi:membrane protease YdiL (CAAX protease family)